MTPMVFHSAGRSPSWARSVARRSRHAYFGEPMLAMGAVACALAGNIQRAADPNSYVSDGLEGTAVDHQQATGCDKLATR
jgi:hypothetical protein